MDDGLNISAGQEDLKSTFEASAKRLVRVDVERYQAYLDGTNMTEAQKEEFLQAIWMVIISFVELGFDVHPLQEVCGKPRELATPNGTHAPDAVCSGKPDTDEDAHGGSLEIE